MKIAMITNSFKCPTELWLWRQVGFMKEEIAYIGILGSSNKSYEANIPVISLLNRSIFGSFDSKSLIKELEDLEIKFKIDTYYIHYLTNAYVLNNLISITTKKVFIHCHGYDITFNLKKHDNPLINFHSPSYINYKPPTNVTYIADSNHARILLNSAGIPISKIKKLYFGVPIEGINIQKQNDLIRILFLGRLVDFKGPDLTIQAYELACNNGLQAELIVVGDGPLMVTCQILKSRSKYSERIKFLGTQPYEVARKIRESCHIFTAHNIKGNLTNQEEAYGVSIVEAMGAGLPVITGRNGGVKETIIHGHTGFLFNPGDIQAHASYLTELARDHSKREQMGKNAYIHVSKRFNLQAERNSLLNILTCNDNK